MKWVQGTPGGLVVKNQLSLYFFETLIYCADSDFGK